MVNYIYIYFKNSDQEISNCSNLKTNVTFDLCHDPFSHVLKEILFHFSVPGPNPPWFPPKEVSEGFSKHLGQVNAWNFFLSF